MDLSDAHSSWEKYFESKDDYEAFMKDYYMRNESKGFNNLDLLVSSCVLPWIKVAFNALVKGGLDTRSTTSVIQEALKEVSKDFEEKGNG